MEKFAPSESFKDLAEIYLECSELYYAPVAWVS